MKLSEQLRREWALIDQPKKWTKGALARNRAGESVEIEDKSALSFCQLGARYSLKMPQPNYNLYIEATTLAKDVAKLFGFSNAVHLNDAANTTHADMRIYYETMIYIAEQCE
jgi:iron uptake system EfeUOB component EfeO/EfeM